MKIMAVYLLQLLKGNDWLIGIVPIAIDKTTRVFYVIENSRLYAADLVNAQQDEIAVYYIYIWMGGSTDSCTNIIEDYRMPAVRL